jgi:hypothetical protein
MSCANIKDHPMVRSSKKFIFSSFNNFQSLPKNVDLSNITDEHRIEVLGCSEKFRGILHQVCMEIDGLAELLDKENNQQADTALDREMLEAEYDTVYSIEKSWHVCEIFFLNHTKLLSIELIKWLKVVMFFG